MARLAEVLAKATSNKWWSVDDVIGKPLKVTEDFGAGFDIRLDEAGKYYCIQVSDGKEVKDLHAPKGALRGIAKAMPQEGNWKGLMFTIDKVAGKGFGTTTHVSRYYENLDRDPAAQHRIPQEQANVSPNNIPPDPRAEAATAILEALRGMAAGVHDSRFEQFVHDTLTAKGIIASVSEVTTGLKYSGRIKIEGDCWKVV